MSKKDINLLIWNEFRHEKPGNPKYLEESRELYPEGIHSFLAEKLSCNSDFNITTATLDDPEHGLTEDVVNNTDVLIWWAHCASMEVSDEVVQRVVERIHQGMGLIVLHSGHGSKVFKALMGTNCTVRWREEGEKERLWTLLPNHPIAEGIGDYIELPQTEMYGEVFNIPTPDEVIFTSWFEGGEVFRSGCVWKRCEGKVFYFRPGHETYPVFYDENVIRVITNAVRYVNHERDVVIPKRGKSDPLEPLKKK